MHVIYQSDAPLVTIIFVLLREYRETGPQIEPVINTHDLIFDEVADINARRKGMPNNDCKYRVT